MLDVAFVLARIAQYVAAVVLFGSPLFCLYGLPRQGRAAAAGQAWPRPLLRIASVVLLAGAVAGLAAQTALMTGAPADVLRPGAWLSVVTGAEFGPAMAGRIALGLAALAVAGLERVPAKWPPVRRQGRAPAREPGAFSGSAEPEKALGRPSPGLWAAISGLGAAALASFAWTGHGASDEGLAGGVHLASDIVHLLAAGVWLGALAVLAMLLITCGRWGGLWADPAAVQALYRGLAGFSGIGMASVAALVASGLINSWFLVGPRHVADLTATAWGRVLCAKLVVFLAMLGLAGLNRWRLTPALERSLADPAAALRRLRLSVAVETGAGVLVLVLVGLLGTLSPPSAG